MAIRNEMTASKNSCILSFTKVNRGENVILYAHCKYKSHNQQYKFLVESNRLLHFFTKGCDVINHGDVREYVQLRGDRRLEVQKFLEKTSPMNFEMNQYQKLNSSLFEKGNTQSLILPFNIRKARSEFLQKLI